LLAIGTISAGFLCCDFRRDKKIDRRKWSLFSSAVAPQNIEITHDLIAPLIAWRIVRNGLSTLKIRVKRRLSI
jgi:hypothetical protein